MKKLLVIPIVIIVAIACHRKHNPQKEFSKSLFRAYDHTAENLFTKNCEGPAVDKDGRLFVVNFQKDGTIGLVQTDGKVEVVSNPARQKRWQQHSFTAEGHMLVADFC